MIRRIPFLGHITLMYLGIFPLVAGFLLNILIIFLPVSYIIYAIPALITGFLMGCLIIITFPVIKNHTLFYYVCASLIAPFITYICLKNIVDMNMDIVFDLWDSITHIGQDPPVGHIMPKIGFDPFDQFLFVIFLLMDISAGGGVTMIALTTKTGKRLLTLDKKQDFRNLPGPDWGNHKEDEQ